MKIKTSHESPIALLDESREYNDYDYCLVHLLEEQEEYRDFFIKQCTKPYREVYFDTSIFELGEAFDKDKYAALVEEFEPTLYIVPDVLEDMQQTVENWIMFTDDYRELRGRKMGVVQGKTYDEILSCYLFMSNCADQIAISFDYSFYNYTGIGPMDDSTNEKLHYYMTGRIALVKRLIAEGHWNWDKPHHLLGCSLPQEFKWYKNNNIHNLYSVDTSNPVTAGMDLINYDPACGLKDKPKVKLFERIKEQITDDQKDCVFRNLKVFKSFIS